jgi:hypothetical protein
MLPGIFGPQHKVWLEQIRAITTYSVGDSDSEIRDTSEVIELKEFQLDQRQVLPHFDLAPTRLDDQKPPPGGMPEDASEGKTL